MKITADNFVEFNEVSLLTNFQEQVAAWSSATFPLSNNKNRAAHVLEEAHELVAVPDDPYEAADIMLLLLHHAQVNGYDLLTATKKKFEIIKKRQWLPPDENGIVRHVKGT